MRILLIEDEKILRVSLASELSRAGHVVDPHERPSSALAALTRSTFDVVITDIRMPGMDGFTLLEELQELAADVPVVFMTAYATVRDAVRAIRLGAFDYLTKPFEVDELLVLLQRIDDLPRSARPSQRALQSKVETEELGGAPSMQHILADLPLVAASDEIVLITGETGTGKEHLARIIHSGGSRASGPFLKVSCAALSPQLVESELFGHERGAFTGAERRRAGRFERARGGTLMLDEVDDVPLPMQVKLLEVLQDGRIERVGGDKPIPIDVRIIAATKADLGELARAGRFRRDLYYRLNVLPMHLPPLRDRREDIPALFERLSIRHAPRQPLRPSPEALRAITGYSWPGNVREIENLVKRLVALVPDGGIEESHLPLPMRLEADLSRTAHGGQYEETLARVERDLLMEAMERAGGNRTRAAEQLGIPASTLRDKLAKHGLSR